MRRRALIFKMGQIGDVVMVVPGVRALYEKGFEIDWICGRAARPLLACYSWINIIPVDDEAIFHGSLLERLRSVASLWGKVGFRAYDLCAVLYYDKRLHLISLPLRGKRKITLSRASRTKLLPGRDHADEYLRLLLAAYDSCKDASARLVRPDRLAPAPVAPLLRPRRVAIVPGGTRNVVGEQTLRRWPVERYAALARQLLDRGWEVVLIGSSEDRWVRSSFDGLGVTDWLGRLSVPEVICACDTCDAVITHDTGPLHLAGLSRACVIAIFGPTDPSMFVPRREGVVGIWGGRDFACRPCYDGRDFAPCKFNGCMQQVSPELVLQELDQVLAGPSSPWRLVHA